MDDSTVTRSIRRLRPIRTKALSLLLLLLTLTGCSEDAGEGEALGTEDDIGELAPGAPEQIDTTGRADTGAPVATHRAVVTTDLGSFTIELYGKDAPRTVENFVGLVRQNYYDSLRFHRVVEDFIVQTGDSLTRDTTARQRWGSGGRSLFGRPFESELDPESPSGRLGYRAGTVAMAGDGENNRSQFFIVLSDRAGLQLPYRHTIFGRVVDGIETLEKIEETGRVEFESPDGDGTEVGFVQLPPEPAMIIDVDIERVE